MTEEIYIIKKTDKAGTYNIARFGCDKRLKSQKSPEAVYQVRVTNRSISCNCPGFYRQKDKTQHKHCLLVSFWIKELKQQHGVSLWFNKHNEIEFFQFLDEKWFLSRLDDLGV